MNYSYNNEVSIQLKDVTLEGELVIPPTAKAIIIFSHGSGSSRFSRRNKTVARYLNEKNFGTLLFDLLTVEEDKNYSTRFDIELLTKRLAGATEWLEEFPAAKDCRIGYFGASTGAASALSAAANLQNIGAVVSRGGRPDLASKELSKVNAPTLLIVGSLDFHVLDLNRQSLTRLKCEKKLEIVEGASHLFEESGKMQTVSKLAGAWFEKYLLPVGV